MQEALSVYGLTGRSGLIRLIPKGRSSMAENKNLVILRQFSNQQGNAVLARGLAR